MSGSAGVSGSGVSKAGVSGAGVNASRSPVLDLRFFRGYLPSGITFTRSTKAWDYDSTGTLEENASGDPRFDYDPDTLKSLGLLVEAQRTNSLLDNRDPRPSGSNWSALVGTPTVSLNEVGLDGVANAAATITDDDGSTAEAVQQTITIPNDSNTHIGSVYIKKDNDETRFPGVFVELKGGTTGVRHCQHMNTKTGATAAESDENDGTGSVKDAGDFWRVIVSVSNNSTGNTTLALYYFPARDSTLGGSQDNSATGSAVFDFGQVELNASKASSPIETGSSAVTVNADDATQTVTDGKHSAVIHARTGYGAGVLAQTDDGTENNRVRVERDASNNVRVIVTDGGGEVANLNMGTVADDTDLKVAYRVDTGDYAACLDGGTVKTDTAGTLPSGITTQRYGRDTAGEEWGSTIALFQRYSDLKSDVDLQDLTS